MKKLILLLTILFLLPQVLAIDITIKNLDKEKVIIPEINYPTSFKINLTNNGPDNEFRIMGLYGFETETKEIISLASGETTELEIKVYPKSDFKYRGLYIFQYNVIGKDFTLEIQDMPLKVIDLKDSFEIGSNEFDPESSSLKIYVKNKYNFEFEKINADFTSKFFEIKKEFSLEPFEEKQFTIELNKEQFKEVKAGFYTLKGNFLISEANAEIEGIMEFAEKDILTTIKKDYGIVIATKTIEKTNEGNVLTKSETTIQKNIISRLFTTFEPQPDSIERNGFKINYLWERTLKPGESLKVIVKTNWLFPFILIFLIIAIVVLVKQSLKTDLILRKKVSFVRAKGGEFALKVSISVHAKKYLEKVSIIDRLPPLLKVHERFGSQKPIRIDEKNKRIEWNFEKLEAGEVRVLSYIIYSKVGVMGKFALPSTRAIYEKQGELKESESNRTFFVAEQTTKDVVD